MTAGRSTIFLLAIGMIGFAGSGWTAEPSDVAVDFQRDVRPILAEACYACHGFDAEARKGSLRLDTAEGIQTAGDSGQPAIVPGDASASPLVARITSQDAADKMPPPDSGKKLKPEQIETLKRWIAAGAKFSKHWSLIPPVKAPRPQVTQSDWPATDFDAFILARLQRESLHPSQVASKATLARRAALDLTGIPPEPVVRDGFLADESPDAFAKYVDKLLESPRFGERWARHWLDLARYADTKGYEKDLYRPMWRYRDWVIAAFNADMPFDQFTREQLAGDLLPGATRDQILATAFHRNTMSNDEGGTDDEEFRQIAVKDRVDTTMQAWMGLTMGCAKCHSHKYDPIAQQEYYRFYAYFNQTEDADRYDDLPKIPTPTSDEERRQDELRRQIAAIETKLKTSTPELGEQLAKWEEEAKAQLTWQVLQPNTMLATSGSQLTLKDDNSILAQGQPPEKETYVVRFKVPTAAGSNYTVGGLRLEALPDPANPRGAAGRSRDDGNFVLSAVRFAARTPDGKQFDLPLVSAEADFAQDGYPITNVLNNTDLKKKGWAISPKLTEPRTAIFGVASRDLPPETELTISIIHEFEYNYPGFAIGRFRLSTTSGPASLKAILDLPQDNRSAEQKQQLFTHFMTYSAATKPLRDELAALQASLADIKPVETPILRELPTDKQRITKLHKRGNFLDAGDAVSPGVPAALHSFPGDAPANRLGVAQWLTSRDNPLTARVAVNRVWAHLFGRGLVETEEDFGVSGTAPSHPEVLDCLAVEYMDNAWSLKKLLKTIVLSSTYRQSAFASPELIARDRDNRLYARGPRFRLEAEAIRDQALAVSGLLSPKIGGPSVYPYQPDGLWKSTYNNDKWQTSPGEDKHRRGIYTFIKRTTPYPQMMTFDGSSRETCLVRRPRTNTPLQALTTLNDPVFVECAQALARTMFAAGKSPEEQIAAGFVQVLGRAAKPQEIESLVALYQERVAAGNKDREAAVRLATDPLGPLPEGTQPEPLAALTAVANVLLNLDEFLTKG